MSYKWQVRIKKTLIRGQTWNIGYHLHPQLEFPKQVVSKPEPHLFQIWKPGSRLESVKWSPITFQLLRSPEVSVLGHRTPLGRTWAEPWEARSLNAVCFRNYSRKKVCVSKLYLVKSWDHRQGQITSLFGSQDKLKTSRLNTLKSIQSQIKKMFRYDSKPLSCFMSEQQYLY